MFHPVALIREPEAPSEGRGPVRHADRLREVHGTGSSRRKGAGSVASGRGREAGALTAEQNRAIERRLDALERKDPLDLDAVTAAIHRIDRPELLAARLGPAIRYSQRVEADVAGLSIDTLLPHSPESHIGRFLRTWVPDESGHGAALELLLDHLGLPAAPAADPDDVPLHNHIVGALARLSPHARAIVSMTYHSIGAMNERLAVGAYSKMSRIATSVGAGGLADDLFRPMRVDESHHLGYYRTYAVQLRAALAPWQLAVVRALIVQTWAPVGAGAKADRAPFGEAILALEEDPENPSIAAVIQEIAQDLVAEPDQTLPPFVQRQLADCIDRARVAR